MVPWYIITQGTLVLGTTLWYHTSYLPHSCLDLTILTVIHVVYHVVQEVIKSMALPQSVGHASCMILMRIAGELLALASESPGTRKGTSRKSAKRPRPTTEVVSTSVPTSSNDTVRHLNLYSQLLGMWCTSIVVNKVLKLCP